MPETIEVDVRMEKLRKLRFQMCPDDIEWKEVDHLLVEKSAAAASIVRDFTVHHQRSPLVVSRPKELGGLGGESGETILDPDDPQWNTNQNSDDPLSPPFELQTLDDSPRSSQLHIKDVQEMEPDGQESRSEFFELGVMQETPPDILEPTKQAYFAITTSQQILSNPVLTTFCGGNEIGEQCVITTRKPSSNDQCALVNEGLRTNTYSTFRPPANPSQCTFQSQFIEIRSKDDESTDTVAYLQKPDQPDIQNSTSQPKTSSPSLKSSTCEKPIVLKDPDIGDESITLLDSNLKKKDVLGMQVATPVVPPLEKDAAGNVTDSQSKKGWSITTV